MASRRDADVAEILDGKRFKHNRRPSGRKQTAGRQQLPGLAVLAQPVGLDEPAVARMKKGAPRGPGSTC